MSRNGTAAPALKAWRVYCPTIMGSDPGIYAAGTRGGAIGVAFAAAREVGYAAEWSDFRAIRAPEYDAWAVTFTRRCGLVEDVVKDWMAAGTSKE